MYLLVETSIEHHIIRLILPFSIGIYQSICIFSRSQRWDDFILFPRGARKYRYRWASRICRKAALTSALYIFQSCNDAKDSSMGVPVGWHVIKSFLCTFLKSSYLPCGAIPASSLMEPSSLCLALYSTWLLITLDPGGTWPQRTGRNNLKSVSCFVYSLWTTGIIQILVLDASWTAYCRSGWAFNL